MFSKVKERLREVKNSIDTINRVKQGTLIFCPFCESPCVSHSESEKKERDNIVVEKYLLKCENCNAIGMSTECWDKLGKEED